MEGKRGQCYLCRNFQRYYTRGNIKFNRTKFGRCCNKDETVQSSSTCENWRIKTIHRHVSEYAKLKMNDILHELSAVRQIIEERQEEYEELQKL